MVWCGHEGGGGQPGSWLSQGPSGTAAAREQSGSNCSQIRFLGRSPEVPGRQLVGLHLPGSVELPDSCSWPPPGRPAVSGHGPPSTQGTRARVREA